MKVTLLKVTPDAEELIASSARVCYASTPKTPDANKKLLSNLVSWGHLSMFEHASATFLIEGVSRACTHQLVRHRIASFSQQSQRYVNEEGFEYVTPDSVKENKEAKSAFDEGVENTRRVYKRLAELGIPKEDARFILPNACATKIVMTMNFRELRHFIRLRTEKGAQWEIKKVASEILSVMKKEAPTVFSDL